MRNSLRSAMFVSPLLPDTPRMLNTVVALLSLVAVPQDRRDSFTVRGRVVDGAGAPLTGAGVVVGRDLELRTEDARKRPQVRTAKDGRFAIEFAKNGAAPLWNRALAVSLAGHSSMIVAPCGEYGWNARYDEHEIGDLVLVPTGDVQGFVRSRSGRGIRGARVRVEGLLTPLRRASAIYAAQAFTDEKGRFVLPGVFKRALRVVVDAPGHYRKVLRCVNSDSPLVIKPERSGYVEGRVFGGKGVRDVAVQFAAAPDENAWFSTDKRGAFKATLKFPGRYVVVGGDFASGNFGQTDWLTGKRRGVKVKMPANPIRIRAKDAETGGAVRGLRAGVSWGESIDNDEWMRLAFGYFARRAGAGGEVCLIPSGEAKATGALMVSAPEYVWHLQNGFRADPKKPTEIEVELKRGASATGTVVDPATGKPWSGVDVVAYATPHSWEFPDLAVAKARTDGSGAFRMRGLTEGKYLLMARHPDTRAEAESKFQVGSDGDVSGLRVELPKPFALEGTVDRLDPKQRRPFVLALGDPPPIFHEPYGHMWFTGTSPQNVRHASPVAADGTFRLDGLSRSNYSVHMLWPTPPRTGMPVRTAVGNEAVDGTVEPMGFDVRDHRPARVAGTLQVRGAKVPVDRFAVVSLWIENPEWSTRLRDQLLRTRWALPENDGTFELTLAPGDHRISVVDLATGVRVHLEESVLEVAAGEAAKLDLVADVATVRVALNGELGSARFLAVEIPQQVAATGDENFDPLLGLVEHYQPGVSLSHGPKSVEVIVPEGPVNLIALPGADEFQGLGSVDGEGDRGRARCGAISGETTKVALDLRAGPK